MRVLADEMKQEEARSMMLKLADGFDKLGDRAQCIGSSKPPRAKSPV